MKRFNVSICGVLTRRSNEQQNNLKMKHVRNAKRLRWVNFSGNEDVSFEEKANNRNTA